MGEALGFIFNFCPKARDLGNNSTLAHTYVFLKQ